MSGATIEPYSSMVLRMSLCQMKTLSDSPTDRFQHVNSSSRSYTPVKVGLHIPARSFCRPAACNHEVARPTSFVFGQYSSDMFYTELNSDISTRFL